MYFDTFNKNECTGCTACKTKCPVNAISMKENGGFLYPNIDDNKCIHCGLCRVICEKVHDIVTTSENKAVVYGWNRNYDIRWESTSGGAFRAIVDTYLTVHPDAWIYGVVYENTFRVIHKGTQDCNLIHSMCRSKYLQSDIQGIYDEILKKLKEGKYVLFSGTPCQVAGLKVLADRYTDNLFTVDFICHGVSNPDYFERYLKALGKRNNSEIKSYSFRNKKKSLIHSSYRNVCIAYQNGKSLNTEDDLYVISYKKRFFYRDSCYNCSFANNTRCSDITMGDFWGIEKEFPELKKQRLLGISLLMFNSDMSLKFKKDLEKAFCMYRYNGDFEKYSYLFVPTQKPTIILPNVENYADFIDYLEEIITPKERWKYLHPNMTMKLQRFKRRIYTLIYIIKTSQSI